MTIKPCPYCGSTDLGIGKGNPVHDGHPTYVFCDRCDARGPWIYTAGAGIVMTDLAFACEKTGWNKRAFKS